MVVTGFLWILLFNEGTLQCRSRNESAVFLRGKNKGTLGNLHFSYSINLESPLPKEFKYMPVHFLINECATVCHLFQSFIRIFFSLSNHASCSRLRTFLLDLFIKDKFLFYIFQNCYRVVAQLLFVCKSISLERRIN